MTATLLFTLLLLFGLLAVLARRAGSTFEFGWSEVFAAALAGILCTSYWAIVLLELAHFTAAALCLALAGSSGLVYMLRRRAIGVNLSQLRLHLPLSRIQFAMIAVLVGAALLRWPPANYLAGGQDQGIYVNMGNHFAKTGEVFFHDDLPQILAGNERLLGFYEKHTLSGLRERENIPFAREVLPGLYFHHEHDDVFVPQFYHLHPLWLAISHLAFGEANSTLILLAFSLLTVIGVYLLSFELTRSAAVGLFAAAMLAANPAHSYFAKFPVSETVAGMFTIAGFYFWARWRERVNMYLVLCALSFGAAFFTRISGFIILCCLLACVALRLLRAPHRRRIALTRFSLLLTALYAWSFFHGLHFSFPYSRHIYWENLKIRGDIYLAGTIFIVCCAVVPFLVSKAGLLRLSLPRRVWASLLRHRSALALLLLAVIFSAAAYRGYLLGFTDSYADHPYFGKRWRLAAKGVDSLYRVNPVVLARFLTPLGAVFFVYGLYCFVRRSLLSSAHLPVAVLLAALLFFYSSRNFVAANYYYYTRYLCSEVLPLAVICSAAGFWRFARRFRPPFHSALAALFLAATLVPSISRAMEHGGQEELAGFYDALKSVNDAVPDDAIIVLDRRGMPYEIFALPLILSFDRRIIIYRFDELLRAKDMNEAFGWLEKQGHPVFLVSAQTGWKKFPFFRLVHRSVVPQRRLQLTGGKTFPSWQRTKRPPGLPLHVFRFERRPAAKAADPEQALSRRILVGAHYYLWHPEHFKAGDYLRNKLVPPQEPLLGEYSSSDVSVAEQHIRWASRHGIDFFTLDYWPSREDYHSRIDTAFLKAKNIGDISFCIFYESQDLHFLTRWGATVFTQEAVKNFVADIRSFSRKYFKHPSYFKIDGRPVVVLYLTRTYAKHYEQALREARAAAKEEGFEVYFIGDEIFWDVTQERKDENSFRLKSTRPQLERIKLFDAITSYNLYTRRYKRHRGYDGLRVFLEDNKKLFQRYIDAVPREIPVIPVVLPGYNDRAIEDRKNHAMPRRLAPGAEEGGFFSMAIEELAKPLLHPDLRLFFITSWNEWMEDTAIEPVKPAPATARDTSEDGSFFTQGYEYTGYGMAYLEVLRDRVVAVAGRVSDAGGSPAAGVDVYAWKDGAKAAKTTSHSDGYFTLSRLLLPPGNYNVGLIEELAVPVVVTAEKTADKLELVIR